MPLHHRSTRVTRPARRTTLAAVAVVVAGLLTAVPAAADPTTPPPAAPGTTAPGTAASATPGAPDTATSPTPAPSEPAASTPAAPATTTAPAPSATPSVPATDEPAVTAAALPGSDPSGALERVGVGAGTPAGARVAGWAADPDADTPLRVDVYVDGRYAGGGTANGSRPDIASRFGIGANHGFDLVVPASTGTHTVCVYALNIGAGTGNPQLGCGTTTVSDNPFGWLDGVYQSGRGVTVKGWAVDPNSADRPLLVDVWSGSTFVGTVTANATRTDVGAFTGMGSNHGFQQTLPLAPGRTYPLCLYLLNTGPGTGNPTLGCSTVTIATTPFGWFDVARMAPGGVYVRGWGIDPDTTNPMPVDFWSGGTFVGEIVASASRPDVAGVYPGYGPNHGFDQVLPVASLSAPLCAYLVDTTTPGGPNPLLGCMDVTVSHNPIGDLNTAGAVTDGGVAKLAITGWGLDPDTADPITVHVYVNGAFSTALTANGNRPDVAAYFPSYGAAHGYAATLAVPSGPVQVCVYGINVGTGAGTNPLLAACRTVVVNNDPVGAFTSATQVPNGVRVVGWAVDPNTNDPIRVDVWSGSTYLAGMTANLPNADGAKAVPAAGPNHGFDLTVPAQTGTFNVCVYALNVGAGTGNPSLGCKAVPTNFDPFGWFDSATRGSGQTMTLVGWAIDPDTTGPVTVVPQVDGVNGTPVVASLTRNDVAAARPGYGAAHGFSFAVPVDDRQHTVCIVGKNLGTAGKDATIGCLDLPDRFATAPPAPRSFTAQSGYASANLSWTPPADDGGANILDYTITVSPGGQTMVLGADARSAVFLGLAWNATYSFTLTARNVVGRSAAATSNAVTTYAGPPPQTSAPTVSTSRYMRNVGASGQGDLDYWWMAGVSDAAANPSGHQYVSLLDIGGQTTGGVLLSAVSKFVSYPRLVQVINTYVDGYASRQAGQAPVMIAIGTNNDVQVDANAGAVWAQQVVNPVRAYASRYPGVAIAGANDIEPGFRGSASATRAWLSGYLGATTGLFINNGSADGCSQTGPNGSCNNGWTAADLYWLSKGAAPDRMTALPQIYYTSQARQWKWISITGSQRINFFGALTEVQACAQAGGSCYSMSGTDGWNTLWSQLQSDNRSSVGSLPTATDLRIN